MTRFLSTHDLKGEEQKDMKRKTKQAEKCWRLASENGEEYPTMYGRITGKEEDIEKWDNEKGEILDKDNQEVEPEEEDEEED